MIRSMTGFGRADRDAGAYSCKAEIRSVNNRFIDINMRLPKYLNSVELALRKLVKSRCARGSFDIFIGLEKNSDATEQEVRPNLELASQYFSAFNQIKDQLGLKDEINLQALLSVRDIVKFAPIEPDKALEETLVSTVDQALTSLIQMRGEEGNNLEADLLEQTRAISDWADKIRQRQPQVLAAYRDKLQERIKTLTAGIELDEARLAQEVALTADRCDISEELIRLESHLKQFQEMLQLEGPVGRKLEFLTQELNRETNTIGSKSIDHEISQTVIEIKSLLEKIREQLQNVE
ncbi:MAG: YicC/YloC family endoribonuclease [Nitrospinaceae bacterium]